MSPEVVQTLLVVAVVAAAALYLGVRGYRTLAASRRKSGPGCGGGCGCSH